MTAKHAIRPHKLLLLLLFIVSCDQDKSKSIDRLDINYERSIILDNRINQKIEIEVGLDSTGGYRWKRTRKISIYNHKGLLSMEIRPRYMTNEIIKSENESLDDYLLKSLPMGETNIPTGYSDTTFYKYDNEGNLISEQNNIGTITYKYDKHQNRVERCFDSKDMETTCSFSIYEYGEGAKIVARIDSMGPIAASRGHKYDTKNSRVVYEYDNTERVIFDGRFHRTFNQKNQVVEEETDMYKSILTYNTDNQKVQEAITYKSKKPWTNTHFFYYNGNLVREVKVMDDADRLVELINYEYKFY